MSEPTPPVGFAARVRRALLSRLLAGHLPAWGARRISAWTRTSPAWAADYDALVRAERAASTPDAPLTAGQKDRVAVALFSTLDEALPHRPALPLTLSLGSAAAAAVVLLLVFRPPDDEPDGLVPRGAEGDITLLARCLVDGAVTGRAAAAPRDDAAALDCPAAGALVLSLTNRGREDRVAFVVGRGAGGAPRWLAPFSPEAPSRVVPAGAVDRPLDVAAGLAPFAGETITLRAVFVRSARGDARALASSLARGAEAPADSVERILTVRVGARADGGG